MMLVVILSAGCASEPSVPLAYVAIASNARSGDMQITAIDNQPISESNGELLPAGIHNIKFACQLDNGIGATFATEIEMLANHSYCFFSQDQGHSCKVMYTRVEWNSGAVAICN